MSRTSAHVGRASEREHRLVAVGEVHVKTVPDASDTSGVHTRFVYLTPPLGIGPRLQGYVLAWRKSQHTASPPFWEAYVVSMDERRGQPKIEWVPAVYLEPVVSERPSD